jgi:flagellar assembly protein FliH
MAFSNLIAFDRPLAHAAIPGRADRFCTEAELAAVAEESYRRGVDATRALADQQMVESRADIAQLSEGVLGKLAGLESALLAQLQAAMPGLAVELARRLLAGYEPSADTTSRLCEEVLQELFPERENLELAVSAADAALLEKVSPEWMARYPGLRIRVEPSFQPGDCQVRSRFGLTDGRRETKLQALARGLAPS